MIKKNPKPVASRKPRWDRFVDYRFSAPIGASAIFFVVDVTGGTLSLTVVPGDRHSQIMVPIVCLAVATAISMGWYVYVLFKRQRNDHRWG